MYIMSLVSRIYNRFVNFPILNCIFEILALKSSISVYDSFPIEALKYPLVRNLIYRVAHRKRTGRYDYQEKIWASKT